MEIAIEWAKQPFTLDLSVPLGLVSKHNGTGSPLGVKHVRDVRFIIAKK